MKKLLTILLSMAMIVAAPTCIFADENPVLEEQEIATDSAEIALTATKASSYTVKLPKTLDVSKDETTFAILAQGDVDGAYELAFEETNAGSNKISDASGRASALTLTVTVGSAIHGEDIGATYNSQKGSSVTIKHSAIVAGSWAGILPILIKLQKITA